MSLFGEVGQVGFPRVDQLETLFYLQFSSSYIGAGYYWSLGWLSPNIGVGGHTDCLVSKQADPENKFILFC